MGDTAEDGSSLAGVPNLQVKLQLMAKPGVADSPKPRSVLICSGLFGTSQWPWTIRMAQEHQKDVENKG